MTEIRQSVSVKDRIVKEAALLGGLVLAGLVLLPIAIYLVGQLVFGAYGGHGFTDFYQSLHIDFRAGQPAALFLLLSPCIIWLLLRLVLWIFRRGARGSIETR